jgi:hypothetical protein
LGPIDIPYQIRSIRTMPEKQLRDWNPYQPFLLPSSFQEWLPEDHPEGLSCPNGHEPSSDWAPHDRRREPIVDYRCRKCGAVFNIFTDTMWSKTHYDPSTIVMLLRGFAKGVPTKWLTDKMQKCGKKAVLTVGTSKEATIHTDENRSYLWLESEEESRENRPSLPRPEPRRRRHSEGSRGCD